MYLYESAYLGQTRALRAYPICLMNIKLCDYMGSWFFFSLYVCFLRMMVLIKYELRGPKKLQPTAAAAAADTKNSTINCQPNQNINSRILCICMQRRPRWSARENFCPHKSFIITRSICIFFARTQRRRALALAGATRSASYTP